MAITNITDVFAGATIGDGITAAEEFDLVIPSGAIISCPLPATGDPNEIVFGLLETIYQGVSADQPTYLRASASSSLANATTYRRTYSFTVDLDFDGDTIIEGLDVKPEPVE